MLACDATLFFPLVETVLSDFDFGARWTTEATTTTAEIAAGFFNRLMTHPNVAISPGDTAEAKQMRLTIPNIQTAIQAFLGSSPIVKSGFSASLQQVKWYQRAQSLAAQTIARHGKFFEALALTLGEHYSLRNIEEKLQPVEASSPIVTTKTATDEPPKGEDDDNWLGFVFLASFMEALVIEIVDCVHSAVVPHSSFGGGERLAEMLSPSPGPEPKSIATKETLLLCLQQDSVVQKLLEFYVQ